MDYKQIQAKEVVRLWKPIRKNAFRIVNSITNDPYLTEDVLQDTILVAAENLHKLKDISKFDKWFYTISTRLAYDALKERKRAVPVEEVYKSEEFKKKCNQNLDKSLLLIEDNDEYLSMVMKLPQRERHLIHLRFVQQLKVEEISELTNIKLGTLKSLYHRAFKKLRKMYEREQRNVQK
jgi:RNA polymerase sigma-70 factor (ECF subfamily)